MAVVAKSEVIIVLCITISGIPILFAVPVYIGKHLCQLFPTNIVCFSLDVFENQRNRIFLFWYLSTLKTAHFACNVTFLYHDKICVTFSFSLDVRLYKAVTLLLTV